MRSWTGRTVEFGSQVISAQLVSGSEPSRSSRDQIPAKAKSSRSDVLNQIGRLPPASVRHS